VTCQERFDATRRAIQARSALGPDGSAERLKWIRLELALVLAESTGRRIGAIRQLRWEDIDYSMPAITWRADADKMGVLWTIDLSTALVAELRRFQTRLSGVCGWVFPAARLPDQPTDRWSLVKFLLQAERDAGLPKLVAIESRVLSALRDADGISKRELRERVGGRAATVDAAAARLIQRGQVRRVDNRYTLVAATAEVGSERVPNDRRTRSRTPPVSRA